MKPTLFQRLAYFIALLAMVGCTWYLNTEFEPYPLNYLYYVFYPIVGGLLVRYILRQADLLHKPTVDFPIYLYLIAGGIIGVLVYLPYRFVSFPNALWVFVPFYVTGSLLPALKVDHKA